MDCQTQHDAGTLKDTRRKLMGRLGYLLFGAAAGVAAGLLYAPRTGEETRALVADKANEAWGTAQQYGSEASERGQQIYSDLSANASAAYQSASETARNVYSQASETAQSAFAGAQQRVQDFREQSGPVVAEKSDELREKIDAARQRIANQVAKNAEEAQNAMSEKIPAAADAAVDAVASVRSVVDSAAQKLSGKADQPLEGVVEQVEDASAAAGEAAGEAAK